MEFDVITIFPESFCAITHYGISQRALQKKIWQLTLWNPRDFTTDQRRTVDDRPYGGGPGMVMMIEPLAAAIEAAKHRQSDLGMISPVIYLSPQGKHLNHDYVKKLTTFSGLILLAGRYEGIDERLFQGWIDEEISMGDFVVSGGELPAMLLMDAVIRQLPGALQDPHSALEDSFVNSRLDYPHYTRPRHYQELSVPEVLLSGNHSAIAGWRHQQALKRTWQRRPELLNNMSPEEIRLLSQFQKEEP